MKRLREWWKAWLKKQWEKPVYPILGFGRDCFPPLSEEEAERIRVMIEERKRQLEQEEQQEEQ